MQLKREKDSSSKLSNIHEEKKQVQKLLDKIKNKQGGDNQQTHRVIINPKSKVILINLS